jgi:hypothetical protein
MYKTTLSLLMICCFWTATVLQAQHIVIQVDANCQPSVVVDNRAIPNEGAYSLSLAKVDAYMVLYNNACTTSDVFISIKSLNQQAGFIKENLQKELRDNNAFMSLRNLVKKPSGMQQINLSQPFVIFVLCPQKSDTPYYCTLVPQQEAAVQPASGGSQGSNTGNANMVQMAAAPAEQTYMPGSAVYDALKLADNNNLSENELQRIATYYYPNNGIDDVGKAKAALRSNPFMANMVFTPGKNVMASAQSSGQLLSSLSLSSIGGLDVTNLVDGLAKFLVKRTKEELTTAFFQKFKEKLDELPDLQTLFPKTYHLLAAIGTEVYNYEKYIQNLREAFKDDIETLYEHLPGIIPNHPDFFDRHEGLAASLRSGCYLVGALKQQVHPGDVLANYPVEYLDSVNRDWKGSIQTLQLLSASMRDTTGTDKNYWVNIKYLRQLVNTKNAFVIYLGLVYQMAKTQYNDVPFESNSLVGLLDNIAPRITSANDIYNAYSTYILRFGEKTDALNNMIASYTKPANDSLALELYKKYFDAAQGLIDYAAQVGQLPLLDRSPFLHNLPTLLKPYFTVTNLTTDLVIEINRKNYSAAINNAVLLYDYVRHKPAQAELDLAKVNDQATVGASANNPARMTNQTTLATAKAEVVPAKNTLTNLARYGAFMSAIATAKTSDEVAEVIETFALPAGSSRIKRQSDFNVALNAYVGLYGGGEYLPSLKKNATAFSAGLTAPVGVAFSWGKKGCGLSPKELDTAKTGKPKGSSYTLFVSLIDIGAAAAFRFGDTSSNITSTIQLKNIIAPGLYFYYGFRNSPFSVGLGAQLGPQLRKIDAAAIDVRKDLYIRFGLSFAVDIPLLNFYTRNK